MLLILSIVLSSSSLILIYSSGTALLPLKNFLFSAYRRNALFILEFIILKFSNTFTLYYSF